MKVSVCFSTTGNWFSRVIRWMCGCPASHCFLIVIDAAATTVIEAADSGVREMGWLEWTALLKPNHGRIVAEFTPAWDLGPGVEFARKQVGQRYDRDLDVADGFVLGLKKLGIRIHNPLAEAGEWNCSELVWRALQESGYPGSGSTLASDTTPADVLALVKHEPAEVIG